jgi:hypothetical protein
MLESTPFAQPGNWNSTTLWITIDEMASSGILSRTTPITNAIDNYVADKGNTPDHACSDQPNSDNDDLQVWQNEGSSSKSTSVSAPSLACYAVLICLIVASSLQLQSHQCSKISTWAETDILFQYSYSPLPA